jgi:hypothetical protein
MPLATSRLAVEVEEPIWTRWRDATGECFDHCQRAEKKGDHWLQTTWRKEKGNREDGVVVVRNREATTYEPEFILAVLR